MYNFKRDQWDSRERGRLAISPETGTGRSGEQSQLGKQHQSSFTRVYALPIGGFGSVRFGDTDTEF